MKKILLLGCILSALAAMGGNRIFSPNIKSLTSTVGGDWLNRPVMELHSADQLLVGFDELSHGYHRLVYRLEHCEADWSTSEDIFESDWLEGFNNIPIDDYQTSVNTTVAYTHYRFSLPNERCRLKMSGNYRLTVCDEDNDGERLLQVEFYVLESLADVGLSATTNTDVDHNVSHQQLSMTLNYGSLRVNNVEEEIRTVVMQNWREDTARRNVSPNFVSNKGLAWEHNRSLIFDAGNEYHKFEVLDVSHPTMGIERITWDGGHYQAYPFAATVRRNYLTDVDADGAFCIRNSERQESDYTCDYVWVNYTLLCPYQGDVYIYGHWTDYHHRELYKMSYDSAAQAYHASLLQKQGYYSYLFITENGANAPSEGSFYQTENRYQALVYYRSTSERTWRLVGYRAIELR